MKHFTLKQCALALCLGLASFLPGQSIATNAPNVSSSIGMELGEEGETTFNPSAEDLSVLERLADAGDELATFYEKEEWKENRTYQAEGGPNIGVTWDSSNPARITSLFIKNQPNITSLDLSGLDGLQRLTLSYNINLSGKLDLSHASSLKQVTIDNSQYLYSDISFPESFDKLQIAGTSFIRLLGTPCDEQSVKVLTGASIDLSPYVTEGTILSWTKNGESVTLEPTEFHQYTLNGTVGDYFVCTLQNKDYPRWQVQTLKIYLDAGEVYYNKQDYKGLLKLASDNPQTPYLQDLFKSDDWKNTGNSIVQLKWSVDSNQNARLTYLRIDPGYNENLETGAKTLDLTAFAALQELNLINLRTVESVDLSNCSALWNVNLVIMDKLTSLRLSNNSHLYYLMLSNLQELTSLDLSGCKSLGNMLMNSTGVTNVDLTSLTNLKMLSIGGNLKLTSVNLSNLTNLQIIYLTGNTALVSLDLSSLTSLEDLHLVECTALQSVIGLQNLTLLNSLELRQCTALQSVAGLQDLTSLQYLYVQNMGASLGESLKNVNFSNLRCLDYVGSDLVLPDWSHIKQLKSLGLPKSMSSFDLDSLPDLESLSISGSFCYSQLKNYRENVSYSGTSNIELPGAVENPGEELRCIVVGNTIDFTSEVSLAGKPTHFIWYDLDSRKEEMDLFVEDANTPGLFTIDPNVPINQSGKYACTLWNEAVAIEEPWGPQGWLMKTEQFQVVKNAPCNAVDVAMLQKIVDDSKSEELKEWWNSGQWKMEEEHRFTDTKRVYLSWNDNGRLEYLDLIGFGNEMTGVLDLSQADELVGLYISYVDYRSCVFPAEPKLRNLNLMRAYIEVPMDKTFPDLRYLDLSPNQQQLDLSKFPVLKAFTAYNNQHLLFSNVLLPPDAVLPLSVKYSSSSYLKFSNKYVDGYNYYGENDTQTIDFSSETEIGAKVVWEKKVSADYYSGYEPIEWTSEDGIYDFEAILKEHKQIRAVLTHEYFPDCDIYFYAGQYTESGDANIDGEVNVLDIAATLPYVLNDWKNKMILFGFCQADMDANQTINVADVVAIVNRIKDKETSSTESVASAFRSAFVPKVYVTSEADGKLYVDTQVPLAGLQLTFTGVEQEIPLLGEVAHFAHAAHASDSLRMVAYSMDASTIPAGRTLLAQLPKGATLVEALFADANAQSLKADLSGIVTATEEIWGDMTAEQVTNYPNPFQGQTTFTYGVQEQADQAVIRIYATNGALVHVLNGLPVALGENQYRATIDLPAGLYLYRLEISRAGRVISTQTNNLIIK